MALGLDANDNVARLMKWLRASDSPPDAVKLREELAYLLFYGDPTWASNDDSTSIGDYRSILSGWLDGDGADERRFLELTAAEADSGIGYAEFVTWFAPVVDKWKQWAKTNESDAERGLPNPGYAADQTPGTQYYWYDPVNEVYLYASTADAPDSDWLSYEDRRYSPVAYDEEWKTNYRQDVVTKDYEYQSRITAAWLTEKEWEAEFKASGGEKYEDDGPVYTVPVYDAAFEMYRRFNSEIEEYEYADDLNSQWLSLSEARARIAAKEQRVIQSGYDQIVLPALDRIEKSGKPEIVSLLSQPDGRAQLRAEVMRVASELLPTREA